MVAQRGFHRGIDRPDSKRLRGAVTLLCLLLSVPAAYAQQTSTPTPAPSPSALSAQQLAISVHNPFEDFVKVPIQSTTGFQLGRDHKVGNAVNIEPLLPFSLNADWDLIARPSLTVAYAPTPHEQSGLEDLQTSFFLTPHNESTWIWGAGPIFQFPTASSSELGSGRWSAGPTAAVVYSEGPWLNAILTDQLMSFAGNRARGSVNQTYIEPMISYNLESGWYADIDRQMTYDWSESTRVPQALYHPGRSGHREPHPSSGQADVVDHCYLTESGESLNVRWREDWAWSER
jgi:hypothetical protein